jgi:hypothetical protein
MHTLQTVSLSKRHNDLPKLSRHGARWLLQSPTLYQAYATCVMPLLCPGRGVLSYHRACCRSIDDHFRQYLMSCALGRSSAVNNCLVGQRVLIITAAIQTDNDVLPANLLTFQEKPLALNFGGMLQSMKAYRSSGLVYVKFQCQCMRKRLQYLQPNTLVFTTLFRGFLHRLHVDSACSIMDLKRYSQALNHPVESTNQLRSSPRSLLLFFLFQRCRRGLHCSKALLIQQLGLIQAVLLCSLGCYLQQQDTAPTTSSGPVTRQCVTVNIRSRTCSSAAFCFCCAALTFSSSCHIVFAYVLDDVTMLQVSYVRRQRSLLSSSAPWQTRLLPAANNMYGHTLPAGGQDVLVDSTNLWIQRSTQLDKVSAR